MPPINQRNLIELNKELIDIDGFAYKLITFKCHGCYKYNCQEEHLHYSLSAVGEEGETFPNRHQGQQMMAEYKDDVMTRECERADSEDYCDCNPSWHDHSPEARKRKMEEFGVEWHPELIF